MSWYATRTGDESMYRGYGYASAEEWDDSCPECERVEDHARHARADERSIASMEEGDSGYTVHWALNVDDDGRCWLNPNHTVLPGPFGTASMLVARFENGFHVHPHGDDHRHQEGFPDAPAGHSYLAVGHVYGKRPRRQGAGGDAGLRKRVATTASTSGTTTSTVADMREGQVRYTDPSAVLIDYRNRAWIRRGALVVGSSTRLRPVRVERRRDGFHVRSVEAPGSSSSVVPDETMLPVQSLNGNYRDARSHGAALSRTATLVGVEQHLSLDFKRKAKDKDWPIVEMTRAVADALDAVGENTSWEKVRQDLVSTAPEGTLEGGIPVPLPAPSAVYWLLAAIRAVVIVGLFLIGSLGLLYLADEAMRAALNHLLEKVPFARETSAGILRGKVVELAAGWGIPESALPYAAMAPVWSFAVPGPKRPVPPPVVPDNYWKQLVKAVQTNRAGAPAAVAEAPKQRDERLGADMQRKIADAKAALADLDKQWLDFTTATTPDGLRAYYFEMPALWRRPAAPAVTEYETALFELRELLNALPAKAAAEDADRASRAAERALTAWSDAQQYAISIGIDDGRSVEEASAARQLPKLLAQFLDPSTGAAQATRLRTIIEQQMRKLTTRPAAEHMDAVNAGALHLHRAPVLAAIER